MAGKLYVYCVFMFVSIVSIFADISFDNLAGAIQTFWSDTNGLPSNGIMDILQDETGYMWLASYEGLIRFDGNTFTLLSEEEHNFCGVSPRVFCEDVEGALWIGTNSTGVYKYENQTFYSYGIQDGLPSLSIRAIKFDKNNNLWVGTADGLAILKHDAHEKNGDHKLKFTTVFSENNKSFGIVSFVLPVQDSVFIGSNLYGLNQIRNGKIQELPYADEVKDYIFTTAYLDYDGSIWFGSTAGTIFRVVDQKIANVYKFEKLKGVSINKFLRVKNGTMYIGTDKGIVKIRAGSQDFFSEENGLPDNIISALCQDVEGNLWVGMERGGLGKFSKGKFIDLTSAESLPAASCNAVVEDSEKNIWVANDDGVFCVKDDSLTAERKKQIESVIEMLRGKRVRQMRVEKNGTLFFATYSDYGLVMFTKKGAIKILSKSEGLPNNRVRFSYRDGNLWIGTTAGTSILVNETDEIINLTQANGVPNLFTLCSMQTNDGSVWLGTDGGGAVKLDISGLKKGILGKESVKIENIFTKADGLSGDIVFRIVEDTAKNVWFCTSEGLTLYREGKFYPANKSIGLFRDSVFNVVCEGSNNLWIMTSKELLLIAADSLVSAAINDKIIEKIIRYNRLDGLKGQITANAWAYLSNTGRLFIPTLKGVAICDQSYYVANNFPPPVVIENYILDDKKFNAGSDKVIVSAGTKRIMFKFTALSFTIPERVHFEYKLEGYDTEWRSCGTTREIAYTNLYPGNYVFKVRAINNDGIVNKSGAKIELYKKPFFYQTIWFYIVMFLIIAGGVTFAVNLRFKNLQHRANELDKRVKEKTKELVAEKEKSDKLLKNTLPLPVIDEIIETGKFSPKVYSAVSVLFADLVSFTEWADKTSPEVVIMELNKMFTLFDNIMDKYGCERIKTLGDGYMACCGLRGEFDHAERLAGAAVEILKTFDKINQNSHRQFKLRIGMDSGEITGGIVGEHKYVFDLFGDVVNTAFRLEAASAPMGCTISKKTAEIISKKYKLYKRPSRSIKGKGLLTNYYIVYNTPMTQLTENKISELYEALCKSYNEKKFNECATLLMQIDLSLVEPEMLKNITTVKQNISKLKM